MTSNQPCHDDLEPALPTMTDETSSPGDENGSPEGGTDPPGDDAHDNASDRPEDGDDQTENDDKITENSDKMPENTDNRGENDEELDGDDDEFDGDHDEQAEESRPTKDDVDQPEDVGRPEGSLLAALRSVLDSMVAAEREGRSAFGDTGRFSGDRFTVEYGFSGQIGGPRSGREADERSRRSRSAAGSATGSTGGDDESHLVTVRETDGGLLVVADLPGVEADDITVGINEERTELVVGVGTEQLDRIPLPSSAVDVESKFQHGVLELRLTGEEDDR